MEITSGSQMRKEALEKLLRKHSRDWWLIESLIQSKTLKKVIYQGEEFYMPSI